MRLSTVMLDFSSIGKYIGIIILDVVLTYFTVPPDCPSSYHCTFCLPFSVKTKEFGYQVILLEENHVKIKIFFKCPHPIYFWAYLLNEDNIDSALLRMMVTDIC